MKNKIKILAINICVFLLILLLLELVLRIFLYGPGNYRARFAELQWVQPTPEAVIPDQERRPRLSPSDLSRLGTIHRWNELYALSEYQVFGDLEPNRDAVYLVDPDHPYRVVTNKAGFRRKAETSREKPSNTYRVLALGDSFTFGPYVANHETWPAITEARLNVLTDTSIQFEVLNAGVSGYFLKRQKNLYLERARLTEPDLVVLQVLDNDFSGYGKDSYPRPDVSPNELEASAEQLFFQLKRLVQKYSDSLAILDLCSRLINNFYPEPDYGGFFEPRSQAELFLNPKEDRDDQVISADTSNSTDIPFRAEFEEDFEQLVNAIRSDGHELLLVYLPTQNTLRAASNGVDKFDVFCERLAFEHNVSYLSLTEAFLSVNDVRTHYLWPWNGHLSPVGNLLVAQAVSDSIQAQASLALHHGIPEKDEESDPLRQ